MSTRRKQPVAKHNTTKRKQPMYGGAGDLRISLSDFDEKGRLLKIKELENKGMSDRGMFANIRDKLTKMSLKPCSINNPAICFDDKTPLTKGEINDTVNNKAFVDDIFVLLKNNGTIGYSLQTNLKLTDVIYKQKNGQYASNIFNNVKNMELELLFKEIIMLRAYEKKTTNADILAAIQVDDSIIPKNKIKLYKLINKLIRLNIKKTLMGVGGWVKMDWPESTDTEDISEEEVDILQDDTDGTLMYNILDNKGRGYCVMDGNAIRKFKLIVDDNNEPIESIAENEGDDYTHTINYTLKKNGNLSISLECTLISKLQNDNTN